MIATAPIDAIMQALAVPTRRAVFERIVRSGEITVVELTRGSGVTQGAISQHLKSLKLAGLVVETAIQFLRCLLQLSHARPSCSLSGRDLPPRSHGKCSSPRFCIRRSAIQLA